MADRLDLRRRLNQLAFRQAGFFTAAQARSVGYSYQAQKYHVDRGNWLRVERGLLRLAEWPSDTTDTYARWCTWSAGRGVISHETAAAVHDVGDLDPAAVHLTMPAGTVASHPGIAIHIASLDSADISDRGSFRVTIPTRTVLDLAASDISQEQLVGVIADFLASGGLNVAALRRRMDDFGDSAALRLERALFTEPAGSRP